MSHAPQKIYDAVLKSLEDAGPYFDVRDHLECCELATETLKHLGLSLSTSEDNKKIVKDYLSIHRGPYREEQRKALEALEKLSVK